MPPMDRARFSSIQKTMHGGTRRAVCLLMLLASLFTHGAAHAEPTPPGTRSLYTLFSGRRFSTTLPPIKDFTIHGGDWGTPDGSCIRDYIHVLDLAAAHVKSLEWMDAQPGDSLLEVLNVGTGRGTSVREALAAFEHATGHTIETRVGPRREGDIEQIFADVERAESLLGWKATRSIDEAMRDAWCWQQQLLER